MVKRRTWVYLGVNGVGGLNLGFRTRLSLSRKMDGDAIDNLSYGYIGNRLKFVNDDANAGVGYKEALNSVGDEYIYDANGNMIKDLNKGISEIEYNLLNLPKQIVKGTDVIEYVYSVTGEKLQNKLPGKTLKYSGSFVYENESLKYILMEEGRLLTESGTAQYEYNLTDHLGNVRACFDESGNTTQANSYYPFGMRFGTLGSPSNKYLYNGKELQEENEWLDYGWNLLELLKDECTFRMQYTKSDRFLCNCVVKT